MVTIRLLGEAGRRFGRQFKLAVKTPAEAVRALCVQIPGCVNICWILKKTELAGVSLIIQLA
jgi:predicted phage tail protein